MEILMISLFDITTNGRAGKIGFYAFKEDQVKLLTSDFNHRKKQIVSGRDDSRSTINVERIHVPSYTRNLSLKRIWSHIFFAVRLHRYLKSLNKRPDLIYCAMPTSTAAYVAGKFCKKNNIPFVVDVIDLWPDSLIPIVRSKKLIEVIVCPWKWITREAYKMADYISGESKKYAEIAHNVNPEVPYSHTYLGVDMSIIQGLISQSSLNLIKPDDEIWIAYGGSLGQSYDFDIILNGIHYINKKGVKYKMWFIGGGEKEDTIRDFAEKNGLNIEVTGIVSYSDFLKYLSYCDIAINSFKEGTLVVHSYKYNDYVATGCFVLNNLPGETAETIEKYNIGYNFYSHNFNPVLEKAIFNWPTLKKDLQHNIDKLIRKELDCNSIYPKMRENIDILFRRENSFRN